MLFLGVYISTQAQNTGQIVSTIAFSTLREKAEHNTPFDILINPATASFFKGFSVGVCSEQKWGLKKMLSANVSTIWATKNGTWAIPIYINKAGSLSNTTPSLLYARKVSSTIGLAMQVGCDIQQIEKYGTQKYIDTKLGIVAHATPQLHVGVSIHNVQFLLQKEKLATNKPLSVSYQIAYEPSKLVVLQMIAQKQQHQDVQLSAGIYYRLHRSLEISMGVNTEGNQFWGSGSFIWKNVQLGVSTTLHPQLGITPGLCLIYNPKNN